jgi:DNA-binding MurR/RpiR family transcriptional regulator
LPQDKTKFLFFDLHRNFHSCKKRKNLFIWHKENSNRKYRYKNLTSKSISYNHLKTAIAEQYNGFPRQLKMFGRFALDNPDILALETVTTVAERAKVQPSTIIRFAKAIGFNGFSDIQQICRNRLMEDTSSYRQRISNLRYREDESDGAVLDEFCLSGMEALEQLRNNTPVEKSRDAVTLLKNARDIHLLAQGRSYAVAQYMHYALSRLGMRCFLADGAGGMLRHQLEKVRQGDAVIAISFTPYTNAVSELIGELNERGVKILAITDSALSPLASPATVCFEITDSQDNAFRTLVAPICLAQSLVVSLGHAISEEQSTI